LIAGGLRKDKDKSGAARRKGKWRDFSPHPKGRPATGRLQEFGITHERGAKAQGAGEIRAVFIGVVAGDFLARIGFGAGGMGPWFVFFGAGSGGGATFGGPNPAPWGFPFIVFPAQAGIFEGPRLRGGSRMSGGRDRRGFYQFVPRIFFGAHEISQ